MATGPGQAGVSIGQIAAQIRDGNAWAENELVQRYGRALFLILEQRTRNGVLSQDLFCESFRIALLRLRNRTQDAPVDLAGFLRLTAVGVAVLDPRRHRRLAPDPNGPDLRAAAGLFAAPALRVGNERLRATARAVVSGLGSARDRELLWRHYVLEEDRSVLCLRFALSGEHFDRMTSRAGQRLRALVVGVAWTASGAVPGVPARRAQDRTAGAPPAASTRDNVIAFPQVHPLAGHLADYLADRASPEVTSRVEQALLETPVLVEELELHRALRDALQELGPGAAAFLDMPQTQAIRRRRAIAWATAAALLAAAAIAAMALMATTGSVAL